MKKFICVITLMFSALAYGQNYLMPTSDNGTRFVICSGTFSDDGGPNDYSNNTNGVATFCPGIQTDRMQLNLFSLDIAAGDTLTIYDGDSTAAAVIGTYTNTNTAPGVLQASPGNPTGCLTVRFTSNGSGTAQGWRAAIGCFDPCQTITTNIVTTPAVDPDGILRLCQGDTVNFDGSATFSVDGTGATYEWALGNTPGIVTGQIQSETYNTPGIYFVDFIVTDATGCRDRESRDIVVHVSTTPDFTGTQAADSTICFGESTDITGVVTAEEFAITPSPPVAGQTFLPDGSGVSYTTCVNVDLFPPGATFTSALDLVDIFVNMEHSYLGDLDMSVTAPNGATVALHVYPSGGGTFLGIPIDPGPGPGTGFDYVFTEQGTATQTWAQAQATVATIPAGDYLPVDPFSTFIGSPLNGAWCINITDNLGIDDGYIFFWGLNFNPAIIPPDLSFTPGVGSEQWLPDPSITATNGNIITVSPTTAGQSCYTFEFVDSFGCTYTEQVCIDVEPEILNGTPTDIDICDPTGTTAVVDLLIKDVEVLNGLNPVDYSITYHLNSADAENLVNAIPTPGSYTTTSNPQTIWVAIQDNTTQCVVVESFDITIGTAVFNTVADIDICDDPSNDGIGLFDLTTQIAGILGSQAPANYNVTFHNTQLDADNNTNAIPNPATYNNIILGGETIYVRVESVIDANCNATGFFDITVSPSPTANQPMDMIVCDDASNDGIESFVFSNQDNDVLGAQNATDFNLTYHSSQADADANANALNAAGYQNAGTGPETIYVRIESVSNPLCYNTTSFLIQVDPLAIANPMNDIIVCDDISNDGIEFFDLTQNSAIILGSQSPADFTITYHETQLDADSNANAIAAPSSYANTVTPQQTIYVRIEPNSNANCFDTGTFDIIVSPQPVANQPMDMIVCDDASNDGIETFVLSNQNADVLGAQNPADFSITYHSSQADADANANALNAAGYQNAGTGPETIYVRIESVANSTCYDTASFLLEVSPLAVANAMNDIIVCDDISNDGIEFFDLTQNSAIILGSQSPADFTVTYHETQLDADNNVNAIPAPGSYANTATPQQTIYVRIEPNVNTACFATGTFDIIVSPQPVANQPLDMIVCDDSSNDGIETFVLGSQDADVFGLQNPANFTISYHSSQADADANSNALNAAAYQNAGTGPETIFVRLESVTNPSCFDTTTFTIDVLPLPSIVTPANIELCDDVSGDGVEVFDLTQNDSALLNGINPTTVTLTYHLSQQDAIDGLGVVNSPYTNTTSPETIYVRVEDNTTGCFNTTSFDIIVTPIPVINNAVSDLAECDDDGDGFSIFTLEDRANEILNGQTGLSILFFESNNDAIININSITSPYTNTVSPQQIFYRLTNDTTGCFAVGDFTIISDQLPVGNAPLPVVNCEDGSGSAVADLSIVTAQILGATTGVDVSYHTSQSDADSGVNAVPVTYSYSSNSQLFVRLENSNTGCVSFDIVDLILEPLPAPSLLPEYRLCIDNNGVLLNGPTELNTNLNATDYTFSWTLDGNPISGSSSLNATSPGSYEVTVIDNTSGCEFIQSTVVIQSGIPTSYDVEITSDTFDLIHQVIATASGPDEYWFRLDDGPYVNSGVFNNVTPGIHTVTIAERSGCGEIIVEIFVYGYPDFFTPNNDGFNDTWNVVGGDRLPITRLYIFDRYGKLLKQLDTTGAGWDGFYNGQPLPSSDYWFKIEYEQDGRSGVATGHFALKR